jgi:hypothetical protein
MVSRVDVRHERFDPVGEELHGPTEHHGQHARRDLVGVRVDLEAERAADVLVHDPHAMLGHAEVARQDVVQHVRRLAGVIHRQRLVGRVVIRQHDPRFEADHRMAARVEGVAVEPPARSHGSPCNGSSFR